MPKKKNEEENIEAAPTDAAVETAPAEKKAKSARKGSSTTTDGHESHGVMGAAKKAGKRAEKVGIVASDKMTKTVVVRVDRTVKHPVYRKYVKRRKKFMAHDELGAKTGDKVKIVETRPLSAKKRWRVVEIIQRAEL